MSLYETLSLILAIVSIAALLWQVRVALQSIHADHERRKKQATIEFLMAQVRPLWTEGRHLLDKKWGTGVLNEDSLKQIEDDPEARVIVTSLLGHLEYLSVGINTGIYDKDILFRASGTSMIRLFHRLRPYIKLSQKNQVTAYIEFENLIHDLEERKRKKPPVDGNIIHS